MSTMTWNSLLLSNGSIFSTTHCTAASDTDSRIAATIPAPSSTRRRPPRSRSTKGSSSRAKPEASARSSFPGPWSACAPLGASFSASQGVTENATPSEISIPMLALIGIGLMYGPMSPVTNAIGSSAAITVNVARIVGPPTSSTAAGMSVASGADGSSARWRWMFSTTTIASSTRMPIEKISANRLTRLSVKPHAHDANSVAASVSTTATPTIAASRRPSATSTSATTDSVANTSFEIRSFAFSSAVLP